MGKRVVLVALLFLFGCATKPSTPTPSALVVSPEPCRVTITQPEGVTTITVEFNDQGEPHREISVSGDTTVNVERIWVAHQEVKRVSIREGKQIQLLVFTYNSDGNVATESYDYQDENNAPVADGIADEMKTFTYAEGMLIKEEVDSRDASGAGGPDGVPELVTTHEREGKEHKSTTTLKGQVSATSLYSYDGDRLVRTDTTLATGGQSSLVFEYDEEKRLVRRIEETPSGQVTRAQEYCR